MMFGRTENATQTLLALLQCGIIIGGTLITTGVLKLHGYPDPEQQWPPISVSTREWGFLLLVIPLLWAPATIFLEWNRNFPKRATLFTGLAILLALMWLFFIAVSAPSSGGSK